MTSRLSKNFSLFTKHINFLFLCMTLLLVTGCSWLLTPTVDQNFYTLRSGEYRLDPAHTSVIFKVSHLNLSTYVGRFNQFDASLNFDPGNLTTLDLTATVLTSSVDVNNESLESQLAGSTWFDSEVYSKAILKTLSVETTQVPGELKINAELTLRGVTQPIELQAKFHGGADNLLTGFYTLGFSATTSINRDDFGMDSYIPMVGRQVNIEIFAEFLRQPE